MYRLAGLLTLLGQAYSTCRTTAGSGDTGAFIAARFCFSPAAPPAGIMSRRMQGMQLELVLSAEKLDASCV